jgi:hypothetical protein
VLVKLEPVYEKMDVEECCVSKRDEETSGDNKVAVLDGEMSLFAAIDMQVQELLKPKTEDDEAEVKVKAEAFAVVSDDMAVAKTEERNTREGDTSNVGDNSTKSKSEDSIDSSVIVVPEQTVSQLAEACTPVPSVNCADTDNKHTSSNVSLFSTPSKSDSQTVVGEDSAAATPMSLTDSVNSIRRLQSVFNHHCPPDSTPLPATPDKANNSSLLLSSSPMSTAKLGNSPASGFSSTIVNSPSSSVLTIPSVSAFLPRFVSGGPMLGRWFSVAHRAPCAASGLCKGGLAAIAPANCDPIEEAGVGGGAALLDDKDEEDEHVWKDAQPIPLGNCICDLTCWYVHACVATSCILIVRICITFSCSYRKNISV